jgi:hypothetical protein
VHVDLPLGVSACDAGIAQPFGRFDARQRFVPEDDFFSRLLPQRVREIAESLLAGRRTWPSSDPDHVELRAEFVADLRDPGDSVSLVADYAVRGREQFGFAQSHSDSPRTVIDTDNRHGGILRPTRSTEIAGGEFVGCADPPYDLET